MTTFTIWFYTLVSVLLVSLISLIGILTLSMKKDKLKKWLIYLVSLAAGTLFGGALLHLLPEVVEGHGFGLSVSLLILGGIVGFFFLEKIVHWHHSHLPMGGDHVHSFTIMNLFGDGLHNFLDGLIIGATYLVSVPAGIATTLAVILHEIPQEISDFGVLIHGGFSISRALLFNLLSALVSVVGAIVALSLSGAIENIEFLIASIAIGGFIYIAGSDLIPELHKHPSVKSSLIQLAFFVLGIALMWSILLLE